MTRYDYTGSGGAKIGGAAKVTWIERIAVYQKAHWGWALLGHGVSVGTTIGTAFLNPWMSILLGLGVWGLSFLLPASRMTTKEVKHEDGQ